MKKILITVMAVALCLGLMGGAFAYFSDVETSEGNTFTAGTIDLALNDENPVTGPIFTFSEVKPCEDLAPITIRLTNVGNNEGVLYTCIKYVESDKYTEPEPAVEVFEFTSLGTPAMELTADQFAAILYVDDVTYQYWWPADPEKQPGGYIGSVHNDLSNWLLMDQNPPGNNDGYVSLYELKQYSPMPYDPAGVPFPATAIVEYVVTFHLADSLANWDNVTSAIVLGGEDNRPQADGVEMIVSGILLQVGAPSPTCP